MARRLEFFFDYGSPYSYVADARLPSLCARVGAELAYRPMLLGGVFKATGNRSPAQEPIEAKRRYSGAALLGAAADPAVKAELKANTEEAVARGAFGAPTFLVGDQLFFGADHLRFAEQALKEDAA